MAGVGTFGITACRPQPAWTSMRITYIGILGFVVLAACSAVRLRGSTGGSSTPGELSDPIQRPRSQPAVVRSGSPAGSEVRRVCRGSTPGGWIAIDYVADTLSCPPSARRDLQHSTALIVSYRDLQVGEELSVCADARIPRNWSRVRLVPEDSRCAGASKDQPTVVVIRRHR